MKLIDSCIAIIAVLALPSAAGAQSLSIDVGSRIVDFSLPPFSQDISMPMSSSGAATSTLLAAQTATSFGDGSVVAKAAGKAGLMKAYSSTAYSLVPLTGYSGGYAETGASVDFTDIFTVNSSTLSVGTLTTLNFAYLISGFVTDIHTEPIPGVFAVAIGFMRAQTHEDDQEAFFDVPDTPVANMSMSVKAEVGESFQFRYELETETYLASNIPDYRFVESDFYDTVNIDAVAADPDVSFTTASGYDYAASASAPEPADVLLFLPGLVCLMHITRQRRNRRSTALAGAEGTTSVIPCG